MHPKHLPTDKDLVHQKAIQCVWPCVKSWKMPNMYWKCRKRFK